MKINSKDIINKQKEKYTDSLWNEFLLQEFDKPEFEIILNKLIDAVSDGDTFTPPIKSLFADLTNMNPANLKVVIVSTEPINLTEQFFKTKDELINQGVLFYNASRTTIGTHNMTSDWKNFNLCFINHLIATKTKVVYVFVGDESNSLSKVIEENSFSNKVFLPSQSHTIWNNEIIYKLFSDNINYMLENLKMSSINW